MACDDSSLHAYSSAGNKLWSYDAHVKLSPYLSRSAEGTSYVFGSEGSLIAVNRSGRELWRRKGALPLQAAPLIGFDGRIFAFSGTELNCYTASGFRLWRRELGSSLTIPPVLNAEGGLLFALENSTVCTVDAFGHFSIFKLTQKPVALTTLDISGIKRVGILAFPDGYLKALFIDGSLENIAQLVSAPVALSQREGNVAYALQDGTVGLLHSISGALVWKGPAPAARTSATKNSRSYLKMDERGIYIFSPSGAAGFSIDGRRLWMLSIQGEETVPVLSDEGLLYSGGSDWILYAYRVETRIRAKLGELYGTQERSGYGLGSPPPSPWADDPFGYEENAIREVLNEIEKAIRAGDIGEKEREYVAYLMEIAGAKTSPAISSYDLRRPPLPQLRVRAISALGLIASRDHIAFLAELFTREQESIIKGTAVQAIGTIGVDPEGRALTAFTQAIFPPSPLQDERALVAVVSATGALCRFSGPPLSDRGVKILVALAMDDRSPSVRERARSELNSFRVKNF
ncbi:PQQ-binding-like beta-propeller repeat protein [Treponema sp.]